MLYIQTQGPYDHLDHLEKKQAISSLCIMYLFLFNIYPFYTPFLSILYYISFFDSFVGYVNGK